MTSQTEKQVPGPVAKQNLFPPGTVAFAAVLLVAGAAVAGISLTRGEPQWQVKYEVAGRPTVSPTEVARWGLEGRRDYVVVDLRPSDDYAEGHIRGAVSCGTCHATASEGKKAEQGDTFVDLTKKLVLVSETGSESIKLPRLLARNPRLYVLAGGYEGWKQQVMAPVQFGGETDEAQLAEKVRRDAVRAFYAGERPAPSTATLPTEPIHRSAPHAPAKAAEGC